MPRGKDIAEEVDGKSKMRSGMDENN